MVKTPKPEKMVERDDAGRHAAEQGRNVSGLEGRQPNIGKNTKEVCGDDQRRLDARMRDQIGSMHQRKVKASRGFSFVF